MSASQLLRILQTLPKAADDEICAFNKDELEASLNKSSMCTNPFLQSDDVNFWSNPQLASSIFGNQFTNNHEDETVKKSTEVCNIVPSDMFNKTTGFHIDKHSVNCELPELIVCYQESDFHVKNICIHDEDIPDEKAANSILNNNKHTEFLEHKWLRPSTMTTAGCCMDIVGLNFSTNKNATNNHGPENLTKTCEKKLKVNKNRQDDAFTDQVDCNSMLSLQQDWSQEESLEFSLSSNNIYADDANQHPLQASKEELLKRAIVGSEAENSIRKDQMPEISDENKMAESVTFHFNDPKSATSSDPSEAMDTESIFEFPVETESAIIHQQDVGSSKLDVENHHEMRYVGDSSFSMAGVISELISCSRPMPLAAGISSRSNSSATSTRSFAFPTLETEYTSSPVRMGKSERRRLQKQRGWRKGIFRCKF